MRKTLSFFMVSLALMLSMLSGTVQAAAMSNYLENKLIDETFRGISYTPPTTIYVALYTTACSDVGPGTEVAGGAYARGTAPANIASWAGTQAAGSVVASTGTGGTTSNNVVISFPTPNAGWGTVTHMGIADAATAGNMLFCFPLGTAKTINIGDTITYPAGSLTLQIDN